ncbi:WD domain-containing protein [Caballeronia cordobensis]|uniref:WD domain-containing protein n=1 Tax=Caballeronia cordobensis TaxID=1353886 RepID=A0A158I3B3_CABCO|nr:TIR domain-containing protein [Caballeronia cordobensis]SAL51125.1 WD domain-containing protein [Caballeronia cordobensis]
MSKIFISHSSANNALALAIGRWLTDNGWDEYFLDVEPLKGLAPGERWQEELKAAAGRCEAVLFLISPAWLSSSWCRSEFQLAKFLGKTIFGVLVEAVSRDALPKEMTAEWQLCDLVAGSQCQSFRVSHDPLVPETEVSFAKAGLSQLRHGLRRAGLDPSSFPWPPPDKPERPPYPGLRALESEDAAVFFGREAAIVRSLDKLRSVREQGIERMFVILGASGAGKSSFLRAGLWPRLKRDDRMFLPLPVIRPERAVLSGAIGLVTSLEQAFREYGAAKTRAEIRQTVRTSGGFEELLDQLQRLHCSRLGPNSVAPTILIAIDQGEELFSAEGREETLEFTALLAETLGPPAREGIEAIDKRQRALAVVAIRTESYAYLQNETTLKGLPSLLFSLPPIERAEFKAVIEGPAARATAAGNKLAIQPALTERLLEDAEGADALPLLAFTLERLFTDYGGAGNLRVEDYEALGGVRGSIEAAVELAFVDPNREPVVPSDKAERERLLHEGFIPWLARIDPQTDERKRRVARWDELPAASHAVLERIIRHRLLLRDRRKVESSNEEVTVVEVAHEALLRQWPTLTAWLDADADALKTVETVQRAAHEWQKNNHGQAWLTHTDERLTSAEALRQRADFERRLGTEGLSYLRACRERDKAARAEREAQLTRIAEEQGRVREEQARTGRAQRRVMAMMAVTAVILIATGGWIIHQTQEVARQSSLVLAAAGEAAADGNLFDQGLRLGVLATRSSWLHPAHSTAGPSLSRAADESALRTLMDRDTDLVTVFSPHPDLVASAVFSPDGKRVVTASADHTARVWDADTGKPVGAPIIHVATVYSARFSPDGKRVVTASADGAARLWHADTGNLVGAPMTHDADVYSASFSPDGKRVVTASGDKTARVWDADTGKPIGAPMTHRDTVYSASFSPDGKRVVTASDDKTARVWDADTGKPVGAPMTHRDTVYSASFSPDGKRVVTASRDTTARVWDTDTGKPVGAPMKHGAKVYSASFSPDGKRVVTASRDTTARVWDADTGEPVGAPMTHGADVTSASFSSDGKRVLTASYDNTARVWDADTRKPVGAPMTHGATVSASFSPDGKRVVTASADGTRVWDADTGKPVGAPMTHRDTVYSASFSADGKRVVTASGDETARVWDADTGKPVGAPMTHDAKVFSASFSPDGKRVVTASEDTTARVWDADTGEPVGAPMTHGADVTSASFRSDGKRVITASDDKTARVWDADTGKLVGAPMTHDAKVYSASFSPDGKRVVTASGDKTARVWDADTGKPIGAPMTHRDTVYSASFSPDGKRVVTASADHTARVWDADTGKSVGAPMMHDATVYSASFSPDGKRLVTASRDTTACVWAADTGKPIGAPMTHRDTVYSASFSSDGKRVVTASGDKTARVWDADTGKPVGASMKHDGWVRSASFSPDGKRVVTASGDKTARVWDAYWPSISRDGNLIDEVCRRKLRGEARRLTTSDVRAARILPAPRIGEDVCAEVK